MIRRHQWILLFTLLAVLILSCLWIGVPEGSTDMSDRHLWLFPLAMGHTSYLWHHLFTVVPVAMLSFEHRIRYVSKWSLAMRATFFPALLYIGWDIAFSFLGVWSFDQAKITGWSLIHLPWEEWLWFAVVPFACIFIYENLIYYIRRDPWTGADRIISNVIGYFSIIMALVNYDKLYTFLAFLSAGLITFWDLYHQPSRSRSRFYMTFAVSLVPMLIFNGWLTGMFSPAPLVAYHPGAFMGMRLGTMPVEDIFFGYGYLFLIVRFYQQISDKKSA